MFETSLLTLTKNKVFLFISVRVKTALLSALKVILSLLFASYLVLKVTWLR